MTSQPCPHDRTIWPDNWHAECLDCGETVIPPGGGGALGLLTRDEYLENLKQGRARP